MAAIPPILVYWKGGGTLAQIEGAAVGWQPSGQDEGVATTLPASATTGVPGAGAVVAGVFGALTACFMGAEPVVLCGMPMQGGKFFEGTPYLGQHYPQLDFDLRCFPSEFTPKVRSMSGRTREYFGSL